MLDSLRAIADCCSEVTSLKEALYSGSSPFHGKVGEWVLKFVAVRENSMEPMYQGPFEKILQALEGKFLVKWLGVPEPIWEFPGGLRQVLKFKQFCLENNFVAGREA